MSVVTETEQEREGNRVGAAVCVLLLASAGSVLVGLTAAATATPATITVGSQPFGVGSTRRPTPASIGPLRHPRGLVEGTRTTRHRLHRYVADRGHE
jgi:hypothetical protein